MDYKFKPINLKFKGYDCGKLCNETSDEDCYNYDKYEEEYIVLPDTPPLESNEEETKERKELKILTPKNFFTRLTMLLVQTNSYKLKNEIR